MSQENKERTKISLVFPVYNEAKKLEYAVVKTIKELEKITQSYEIIIAEDGSTDGSDRIATNLSDLFRTVIHVHRDKRQGRGQALKNAFKSARGNILIYMDVDLATDINQLKTLVDSIIEGYDLATGSRMLQKSKVERGYFRQLASRCYNFSVRFLLGSKVSDHQCGFKAFERDSLLQTLDEVIALHWFWDTEIIVRYSLKGYKIKEFPVEWKSGNGTKVNLLKDSFTMGSQVFRLWWNLRVKQTFKQKL